MMQPKREDPAMRTFTIMGPPHAGKSALIEALAGLEGGRGKTLATMGGAGVTSFRFMGDDWAAFDIPGGLEFLPQAGPALAASDAAVLCVPAEAGAAVLSAPYLRLLEAAGLPTIIFVNGIDAMTDRVSDVIAALQTLVIIPLLVRRWGKGAYCGWICSCGALAETLGDTHRHKMPHGPRWNRANSIGQVILALCFVMLFGRIASWLMPDSAIGDGLRALYEGMLYGWQIGGIQLNYRWSIDLLLAGVVGYGAYFWYSGRVWCRFACPLAALMHIYARFSRFRILAQKEKCISCGMCTAICHQGIDVMGFANKGQPMADPQCVRCSACVQTCPTGVLSFGQVAPKSGTLIKVDTIPASTTRMQEP